MKFYIISLIFVTCFVLISLAQNSTRAIQNEDETTTQGSCYYGDFTLVSRHYPNCSDLMRLYTPWPVDSYEPCFKKACELGGNVVHFRRTQYCFIYKCGSGNNDWIYNWWGQSEEGVSYALPHPSVPRCHNSYYMRRTWDTRRNFIPAGCDHFGHYFQLTLQSCRGVACRRFANVFAYNPSTRECLLYQCRWNATIGDYIFTFVQTTKSLNTYSLSHTEQCNIISTTISVPSPLDTKLSCPMTGYFPPPNNQLEEICSQSGSNLFYRSPDSSRRSYRCLGNEEGTGWAIYDSPNTCFTRTQNYQLNILAFPGTPNCGNAMFLARTLQQHCVSSSCQHIFSSSRIRDLRECMVLACQRGGNVINYATSDCQVRQCETSNGKLHLQLHTTYHAHAVYALHHDPTTTTIPTTTSKLATTTKPTTAPKPTTTPKPMTIEPITTEDLTTTTSTEITTGVTTDDTKQIELRKYQQQAINMTIVAIVMGLLLLVSLFTIVMTCVILRRKKDANDDTVEMQPKENDPQDPAPKETKENDQEGEHNATYVNLNTDNVHTNDEPNVNDDNKENEYDEVPNENIYSTLDNLGDNIPSEYEVLRGERYLEDQKEQPSTYDTSIKTN